jgi:hypothetical protein
MAIYPEDDQAENAEATSQHERGRSVVLQVQRSLNKTMDVMNPVEFLPGTHRALRKSLQRARGKRTRNCSTVIRS